MSGSGDFGRIRDAAEYLFSHFGLRVYGFLHLIDGKVNTESYILPARRNLHTFVSTEA
jgi:hypothetical protein